MAFQTFAVIQMPCIQFTKSKNIFVQLGRRLECRLLLKISEGVKSINLNLLEDISSL